MITATDRASLYCEQLKSFDVTVFRNKIWMHGETAKGHIYLEDEPLIMAIMRRKWAEANPGLGI